VASHIFRDANWSPFCDDVPGGAGQRFSDFEGQILRFEVQGQRIKVLRGLTFSKRGSKTTGLKNGVELGYSFLIFWIEG